MTESKQPSDTMVLKDYFGLSATEARNELMGKNGLSKDDRALLAGGIRNGSLTY